MASFLIVKWNINFERDYYVMLYIIVKCINNIFFYNILFL